MGTLVAMLAGFLIGGSEPAQEPPPEETDTAIVQTVTYRTVIETSPAEAPEPQPAEDTNAADTAAPETWLGEIQLPGATLDFSITIEQADDDGWIGTVDIPAQNVAGLELRDIRRDGSVLAFGAELPGLPEANWPRWELVMSDDGSGADGLLKQSGQQFPTTMRRGEANEMVLHRPQHPTAPLPYRTRSVRVPVQTEAGEHTLAGTLTLPDAEAFGDGPYPTAVFITGSGPQDRDETLMGHKPFLVVADHLARNGVASLRCDDRGVGASTGSFDDATSFDFADDVRAQIDFLQGNQTVGTVGLIGHSEGGLIAPMVAADSDAVDWLILLAAPGVPGSEILREQIKAIFRAEGLNDEPALEGMVRAQQASFDAMRAGDREAGILAVTELMRLQNNATGMPNEPGRLAQAAEDYHASIDTPWFRAFLSLDPRDALRRTTQPVLVLNGTLDTQVLHDQNVPAIEHALEEAGNDDVTVHVLGGLNHLFQPAETGAVSEYGLIATTFDEATLDIIASWIRNRGDSGDAPR